MVGDGGNLGSVAGKQMKFCMLTSFFGRHSFGGDAVYVDRLSRALLKRGHEVEVVYSVEAYEAVQRDAQPWDYRAPEGMGLHGLKTGWGSFAPLWVHQTGGMGALRGALEEILRAGRFDVLHFHNVSLLGGPGLLSVEAPGEPRRVMMAHEFWLVCPLSVLWKFGERTCEKAECHTCMMRAGRPPQLWRDLRDWQAALEGLDALFTPSEASARVHRARGLRREMEVLPYFVPDEWRAPVEKAWRRPRPYFAFAGRLVKEKGLQRLIPLLRRMPGMDLVVAGSGPYEGELRKMAGGMGNVEFVGRLGFEELRGFYAGARALVAPSLMVETFGYVVAEAAAVGTPAVVPDLGALPELVKTSGGGVVYQREEELLGALERLAGEEAWRKELGEKAREAAGRLWGEEEGVERYLKRVGCG
jgi:glycosyltransferase involved in cell wall biosynthesis